MVHNLPKLIARYWIVTAVLLFALLSAYTSSPIYGQSADPTPDVNTVPRPEEVITPTNTPFPTPTPMLDDNLPGDDDDDDQPQPTATETFDDGFGDFDDDNFDDGSFNDGNTGDNGNGGVPGNSGFDESVGGGSGGGTPPNQESSTDPTIEIDPDALTGMINAVTLNIRRGPGTNFGIVDTIFLNEPVAVLSRDSSGEWWYVCCGSGAGRPGWVSAQYVTPDFDRNAAAELLTISAGASTFDADTEETPLILEMRPSPAFVWQGQIVQLNLILRNTGEEAYTNVRLRNDLPPTLEFVAGEVNDGGELATAGREQDGLIYTISWPEVPSGGEVTAVVTVKIAGNLGNGTLIDNLAVVDTAEGAGALAGLTFAMPPVRLPIFR